MKKLVVLILAFMMINCSAYASSSPLISIGDYNDSVITLHAKLRELGYYSLRAESPFGPQSVEALKTLQYNLDREETGTIQTLEELDEVLKLDHVIGKNLLFDYENRMRNRDTNSPNETLDGETVLHFDYRNSDDDSYVDVISWSSFVEREEGYDFTLSFMAKGAGKIHSFFYPSAVAHGYSNKGATTTSSDGHIATELSEEWNQYTFTWKTAEGIEGAKSVIPVRVYKGTEVWVSKIKFERGTSATEWTLPEK